MSRARSLLFLSLVSVALWSCTEGGGPTASGGATGLAIVPSFQLDPALFADDPIDRIRLTAFDVATDDVVGSFDETVDPSASEWPLSLGIDLGGQASIEVMVEAELFSGGTVVWSGRMGPIIVPTTDGALGMDIYPGPLDNLDVLSLSVTGGLPQLVVGASVSLTALPVLVPGSEITPTVYWASADPTVATVSPGGLSATLTAVSEGITQIFATSGSAVYELMLEVVAQATTPADRTWVGEISTAWSVPENWNPVGVPGELDAVLIPGSTPVPVLSGDATIASIMIAGNNQIDLGGFTLSVSGDVRMDFGGAQNGLVRVIGPGSTLEGVFDDLQVSSPRTATSFLAVSGDLTIDDVLNTNGNDIGVSGNLDVAGPSGLLQMTEAFTYVSVRGSATFNGADHSSALTAGFLALSGDLLATDASNGTFVSSGDHTTIFSGGGDVPQTVTFLTPGPDSQRFNDIVVSNALGVTFATSVYVGGDVDVQERLNVPVSTTTAIQGGLTLFSGSLLQAAGDVTVVGACSNLGAIILGDGAPPECGAPTQADFIWTGASSSSWDEPDNWQPIGVPGPSDAVLILNASTAPVLSKNESVGDLTVQSSMVVDLGGFTLTVNGDARADGPLLYGLTEVTGAGTVLEGYFGQLVVTAPRTTSDWLYVDTDLTVQHTLNLSSHGTVVYGSLKVETDTGELIMDQSDPTLWVYGDATFDGTDGDGDLSGGILYLAGGLTVGETNGTTSAFNSTGTIVYLFDTQNQVLSFSSPGTDGGQSFSTLLIGKGAGTVTFATNAHVTSDFIVQTAQTLVGGGTSTLEVNGDVNLTDVTFNGLMFRMVGFVSASFHTLSNLTFTGMPDDVVQLYVEVPGEGPNAPLTLTNPVFQSAPLQGLYVWAVDDVLTEGTELYVTLTNPTPSTASQGEEYAQSGDAVVTWGP